MRVATVWLVVPFVAVAASTAVAQAPGAFEGLCAKRPGCTVAKV
jgi:hypothetical protein